MKIGLLVSIALFVLACALPALEFWHSQGPHTTMWGAQVLAVGWSGFFAGVLGWFANPFWLAGLIFGFFRKPIPTAAMGVVAIAIACTTFGVVGRELPGDEGDVTKQAIVRLLPGYYAWLASMAALPVSSIFAWLK
ncbi:MAG TPA: hypothetical protein VKU19_17015 [Bryobacteraceae bacterium]|nr:hypothetical protein [Bryobacteraceae bacterium]